MMNLLEEAIIYATILHQGKVRKIKNIPYILHPIEVAQIISTMTEDQEVIAAGVLHDIVEETSGTLDDIRHRFGDRVAHIVESETEKPHSEESREQSWKKRKEESLSTLKISKDIGIKMLWLADKLANIRSLARTYGEKGDDMWSQFNEKDPQLQRWYYKTVAETLELELNRTGAFKEFIKHINFIWPGTFDANKARYRAYREISLDGCKLIGHGAKGDVYRYDDELVIKVYNENNTYKEVEREIELSKRAFVIGLPTAISFGIVSIGNQFGSMFELVDAKTVSWYLAQAPDQVDYYAEVMANLAKQIHEIEVNDTSLFPHVKEQMLSYVDGGLDFEDKALANKVKDLIRALPEVNHLIHGDFHTGNVFLQNGEPMLIDMDRVSLGNPIMDVAGIFMFYVVKGERDPKVVEDFMGFSYETAKKFWRSFIKYYLGTEDPGKLQAAEDKVALLSYVRLFRQLRRKGADSDEYRQEKERLLGKIEALLEKVDSLMIVPVIPE